MRKIKLTTEDISRIANRIIEQQINEYGNRAVMDYLGDNEVDDFGDFRKGSKSVKAFNKAYDDFKHYIKDIFEENPSLYQHAGKVFDGFKDQLFRTFDEIYAEADRREKEGDKLNPGYLSQGRSYEDGSGTARGYFG